MDKELAPATSATTTKNEDLLGIGSGWNGPGCFQFALWSKWAPYISELVKPEALYMGEVEDSLFWVKEIDKFKEL